MYCINLPERSDKLLKLKQNINDTKFDCKLIVVEAINHEIGEIGCGLSHQKVIRMAKQMQLNKVLIVEDDCLFHNDSFDLFEQCMNELPADFDIFLGGIHSGYPEKRVSKHICKLKSFTATHFIIYSQSAYKTVLNYRRGNIDTFLSNQRDLNIYCSYPFIATQSVGFSDIKQATKDYSSHFELTLQNIKTVFT